MKLQQNSNNSIIKGKNSQLIKGTLIFIIASFLLYIVCFYSVKFVKTFKPVFKIGLNEDLKNRDYSKQIVLINDEGFDFLYRELDETIFVTFEVTEENKLGLEPMKFTCEPIKSNVHSIYLKTNDKEIRLDEQNLTKENIKNTYFSLNLLDGNDLSVDKVRWSNVPNPFGKNNNFHSDVYLKSNKDKLSINLKFNNKQLDFNYSVIKTFINYGESSFKDLALTLKLNSSLSKDSIFGSIGII